MFTAGTFLRYLFDSRPGIECARTIWGADVRPDREQRDSDRDLLIVYRGGGYLGGGRWHPYYPTDFDPWYRNHPWCYFASRNFVPGTAPCRIPLAPAL